MAILFLGQGVASVYMKIRADRTGTPSNRLFVLRHIVIADLIFTLPSGILLPVTGLYMIRIADISIFTNWIVLGILLWGFAGLLWIPAMFLQIKMVKILENAGEDANGPDKDVQNESNLYRRYTRIWIALGIPAFISSVMVIYIMTAKTGIFP